nr:putative capsid protein [Poaceae Liege totivirus 1]
MIGNDITHGNDVTYTFKDYMGLLHKLVTVHRWHEDCLNASKLLRPWFVQPATETVESHWWLNVDRSLSLPKLGLRRAIFPMLLEGDGAQISAEALKMSKILLSNNDSMMFESMVANATWYWGEYMNQFNSNSVSTLFHKMDNDYFDTLQPMERADALSSAVLGVAIPRPVFSQMGTYFSKGLRNHYRDTVSFGNIDIPHLQDYGYAINGNRLSTNTLVCPSCTGFVTGLGGSLLNGTPYHSIFQIRAVTQRKVRSRVEQAYNYYDLWAYGVVQRWQGYDVHYKHPRANQRHRIYAANNVSIAMPPVNPLTMDETLPYIMLQDTEREHGFGSSIEWLKNYNMYFVWNRTRIEALREPDYNAMPVQSDDRSMFNADRIQVSMKAPKAYNCLLYATYDVDAADFHVAYPEIAVPLETNVGQLQLGEIDTGPIPEVPPDIEPEE